MAGNSNWKNIGRYFKTLLLTILVCKKRSIYWFFCALLQDIQYYLQFWSRSELKQPIVNTVAQNVYRYLKVPDKEEAFELIYTCASFINSVVESTHHQGQSQQHTEHLPFMHVEVVYPGSWNKRNWRLKWNSAKSYTFWASHGQVDSMRHSDSGTRMGKFGPNSALLGNVCTVGLVTVQGLLKPLNWTKYLSPIYYCTVRKSEKALSSLEILHHLHNCRNLHTLTQQILIYH